MEKSVFIYSDYKMFLKELATERSEKRGFITQLAEATGCQRAYLSQVIHSHVHLTPDHACNLAAFLGFDDLETEYFLALVDLARAGSAKLRKRLVQKMEKLKKQAANIADRVQEPELHSPESQARYYSSWQWGAVHMLVSSPLYQTPPAIASRLGISVEVVKEILQGLKAMGLVKQENQLWKFNGGNIHVPRNSPLNVMNHQNWRTRAVLDVQAPAEEGIHYSAAFTMSPQDAELLKRMVLEFIDQKREVIARSGSEELFCFTCDFFKP